MPNGPQGRQLQAKTQDRKEVSKPGQPKFGNKDGMVEKHRPEEQNSAVFVLSAVTDISKLNGMEVQISDRENDKEQGHICTGCGACDVDLADVSTMNLDSLDDIQIDLSEDKNAEMPTINDKQETDAYPEVNMANLDDLQGMQFDIDPQNEQAQENEDHECTGCGACNLSLADNIESMNIDSLQGFEYNLVENNGDNNIQMQEPSLVNEITNQRSKMADSQQDSSGGQEKRVASAQNVTSEKTIRPVDHIPTDRNISPDRIIACPVNTVVQNAGFLQKPSNILPRSTERKNDVETSNKKEVQKSENTKVRPPKKQYVVGAYTYEDIIATPWLRKLYGHLIGLPPEEDIKSNQKEILPPRTEKQENIKDQKSNADEGIEEKERQADVNKEPDHGPGKVTKDQESGNPENKWNDQEKKELVDHKTEMKCNSSKSTAEKKEELEIMNLSTEVKEKKQEVKEIKKQVSEIRKQIIKLKKQKNLEKDKTKKEQIQKRIEKLKKSTLESRLKSVEKTLKKLQELYLRKVVRSKLNKTTKKIRGILNHLKKGKEISPTLLKKLTKKELSGLKKLLLDKKIVIWLLLGKKGKKAKNSIGNQIKRLLSNVRKLFKT